MSFWKEKQTWLLLGALVLVIFWVAFACFAWWVPSAKAQASSAEQLRHAYTIERVANPNTILVKAETYYEMGGKRIHTFSCSVPFAQALDEISRKNEIIHVIPVDTMAFNNTSVGTREILVLVRPKPAESEERK